MKDYTISELRTVNEAYMAMLEAWARPDAYKKLTPEQAEELAKLSPSYRNPHTWGRTSNWICAVANRMLKANSNYHFGFVYEYAKSAQKDIADFEKFGHVLKKDINSFPTFDDLERFMTEARNNGLTNTGLSKEAKLNGRAKQCYSLMKKGGDDFEITYEDDTYLIGYANNYEYNKRFSSIGQWCHTGSYGEGEKYWGSYAQYPIFYILNKNDGSVLCASYQSDRDYVEVRNQLNKFPNGFNGRNWNEFFTVIGLKAPMVDNIDRICSEYEVPVDAELDVWDRVDANLVDENLFCSLGSDLHLGSDNDGDFILYVGIDAINPESNDDNTLNTRYAANVGSDEYDFSEFKVICDEKTIFRDDYHNTTSRIIIGSDIFQRMWNNDRDMTYRFGTFNDRWYDIKDDITMAERFSTDTLIDILSGKEVDIGYDSRRKTDRIRSGFEWLVRGFYTEFDDNLKKALNVKYGTIRIHGNAVNMSIDADEANSLATRISNGEFKFEKGPDLLALNLGGKNSFAVKRVDIGKKMYMMLNNYIAFVKHLCKTPMDLEGQMELNLENKDGGRYYDG